MKNENKKQSENINNSNEELLLSDVSISNSKQCVNHMAIGRDFTDEFGRRYNFCVYCGILFYFNY